MPFYTNGDVQIHYQDEGSGFPVLFTPGGGLNSHMGYWPTQVINVMDEFKNDFRCITMDQRNAYGGKSKGPIPVDDPWGAFADDQLGLMSHLGIEKFGFMGFCIGGPFALKLIERAPERITAAVLCQPVGHNAEFPDSMYDSGKDLWSPELLRQRSDLNADQCNAYLNNLYRIEPNADFVYSVSRDFVSTCNTPILVMPDNTPSHSYEAAIEVAELAPGAELTVYPWKEQEDIKANTINQVRQFLSTHQS
ncbi:MAG TPA: hypothetical protein DEZ08_03245 [Dehalococcoidia bacterium]|jgi:pimeloyl-ACP methyl ester carboxylesterase|nr:hypothetical protein [Dehalococcoidia bacterium]